MWAYSATDPRIIPGTVVILCQINITYVLKCQALPYSAVEPLTVRNEQMMKEYYLRHKRYD